jgi:hypothetical protein
MSGFLLFCRCFAGSPAILCPLRTSGISPVEVLQAMSACARYEDAHFNPRPVTLRAVDVPLAHG